MNMTKFPSGFLWGGATAANQFEGGRTIIADALSRGKERLQIVNQPGFDWIIDEEKYHYLKSF